MPFGHIYVDAEPADVIAVVDSHLDARGLRRVAMSPESHPRRMQEVGEDRLRLFWIAPRIGRWTGIFEFRYYDNAVTERWGFTDAALAQTLSRRLGAAVYRMEVLDNAGFWLYSRLERGEEVAGGAYHQTEDTRSLDPSHPRYELNRIVEREGFANVGLGYENIPGPAVRPIDGFRQSARGIEGLAGFVHLAYAPARS